MPGRTRITVDYSLCGDGRGMDPRDCCRCLQACAPAVFLLHQTIGARQADPLDPGVWRVTPLWQSLCNGCLRCVEVCPPRAVTVRHAGARRDGTRRGTVRRPA